MKGLFTSRGTVFLLLIFSVLVLMSAPVFAQPPDSLGHHHHFPPFWGSLTDEQRAEIMDTVQAMRARGATREEIHDAVIALLESWGIEPPDTSRTSDATSDVQNKNSKISEFSVKSYPNPFNSETSIEYTINTSEHVNISIYDVSGKCIRILLDSEQKAGTHTIKWDGKDKAGNPMPSGKYFYRVNAGSKSITQEILLLE